MRYGSTGRKTIRRLCLGGSALLLALSGAACSSTTSPSTSSTSSASATTGPQAGGSLTVLEATGYSGDWPDGLDPATNIDGAADQDYMDAVYGELFELGPKGAVIPDLATGYSISTDAKTITLDIRQGVTFTDGTAFNAAAVVWNIDRDLKSACTCKPTWPVTSVTATGPYAVTITLAAPDGAFIDEIFDSTADWIASPTAVQKMGEKAFAVAPVGAGPFEVVSDTLSSVLVLKRNPGYWQKGRPYLDNLTFKSVASDEAGYEALLAHEGQIYVDMSTPSLLQEAAKSSSLEVENQLSTSPYDLQLNTKTAPFNNIKAREAIYAATNFGPILQHVFDNMYPSVEGFTGPGGICYSPTVPGYQGLSQRCTLYNQAADYIAQQFYGPFYFAFAPANVAVKGVVGPGLTQPLPAVVVTPTILWEDVAYSS